MTDPMSRRWKFTVNLDDNDGYAPTNAVLPAGVAYIVWQYERGGNTNHLHVEGYVRFTVRKRMSSVKHFLARNDAHLEIAIGSEEQCRTYCTKDDTRVRAGEELGEFIPAEGKQGKRSDLDSIAAEIDAGTALTEVARSHPSDWIRYHAGILSYATQVATPATTREVSVLVLWGPTGSGKTHRVLTAFPDCYMVIPGRDPFGQYQAQTTILFDEFRPQDWTIGSMNRYLDKWRCPLDRRYNNSFAAWTRVVICSNYSPVEYFITEPELALAAFRRRIYGRCRLVNTRETEGGPTLEEIEHEEPNPF